MDNLELIADILACTPLFRKKNGNINNVAPSTIYALNSMPEGTIPYTRLRPRYRQKSNRAISMRVLPYVRMPSRYGMPHRNHSICSETTTAWIRTGRILYMWRHEEGASRVFTMITMVTMAEYRQVVHGIVFRQCPMVNHSIMSVIKIRPRHNKTHVPTKGNWLQPGAQLIYSKQIGRETRSYLGTLLWQWWLARLSGYCHVQHVWLQVLHKQVWFLPGQGKLNTY